MNGPDSIVGQLDALVEGGSLKPDPRQRAVAAKLDALSAAIAQQPSRPDKSPRWQRFWQRKQASKQPLNRGLYIHGGVGRGKSMLMDMFFAKLAATDKRRIHFHEFMIEVHAALNEVRQSTPSDDPLQVIGARIAERCRILCFDEFHVVNIADAMILSRLFEVILAAGTIMVATSNWPPGRLYENGLNRDRFLPFIDFLTVHNQILPLDGPTDYRLSHLQELSFYLCPLGPGTDAAMDRLFVDLSDGAEPHALAVPVGSRTIHAPKVANAIARFEFDDLCGQPLGSQDYLTLSEHFRTLLIDHVPLFDEALRNEARRFMTLIDVLYERRIITIISAAATPAALHQAAHGAFEFERTVSRLTEMQSHDYVRRCRGEGPSS